MVPFPGRPPLPPRLPLSSTAITRSNGGQGRHVCSPFAGVWSREVDAQDAAHSHPPATTISPATAAPGMSTTPTSLPNRTGALALAWHVLALAVFTYAFRSLDLLAAISGADIEAMYGGHYQFLTILGLWLSRLGMMIALLSDLIPRNAPLKTAKSLVCVAALPVETLISLLYWTVLSINPDLLIPPRKVVHPDNPAQFIWETVRMPLPIDLSMHAAPAFFLLVDYLFFSPPFPASIRPMLVSAMATVAYCAWAEVCAAHNGSYPYPLLDLLGTPARLALYGACSAIFVAVLEVVRVVHSYLDKTWARSWDTLDGQQGKGVVGRVDKGKKAS